MLFVTGYDNQHAVCLQIKTMYIPHLPQSNNVVDKKVIQTGN